MGMSEDAEALRYSNEVLSESEYAEENRSLKSQLTDLREKLTNLLCRIHRDGGHYLHQHGLDKACIDADTKVADLNELSDRTSNPIAERAVEWIKEYGEEVGILLTYPFNSPPRQKAADNLRAILSQLQERGQ
jgi:hypothetical protein